MKESFRGPPGIFLFTFLNALISTRARGSRRRWFREQKSRITADGGSLGSRVDEERSQLRESM